jgi:hypothetical protein
MKKSFKGIYRPVNPKKYVGNVNKIIYRSLLERRFMVYCDNNPDITMWASEEISIRYYSPIDHKYHRYFPDFIIKTSKGKKLLIEVKPYRQCNPPKPPKKKSKSFMRESLEYIKNTAKWSAAMKYCEDNGAEFKLITEKELGVTF